MAGQHLVEHDTERPDVGSPVHGSTTRLLGRHVGRRAEDHAHLCGASRERRRVHRVRARGPGRIERLRQTEVQDLYSAVRANFDVRWLQIAMNDALFVGRFKGVRDLTRDGQRIGQRHRPARDDRGQVLALDHFHDQRMNAAGLLEAVNVRDVWMIQRRQRLRFSCEPSEAFRVVREGLGQHFDRDVTVEPGVAGAVDLAHAACAEEREDLIRAERRAGCERHRVR